MSIEIPSIFEIKAALQPLSLKQIDALGALSGISPAAIYKIKLGQTENPGIETCRKFLPHLKAALAGKRPRRVKSSPQAEES